MSLTCFGSVIWPFPVIIVGEFIVINKEVLDRETLIKNITSFFY